MIEVTSVCKSYGKEKILEDCSGVFKDGTVSGLLGVNGAGKSTFLRLLAGVLAPESGTITYNGEPIFNNPKAKQQIFFLSDDPYYQANATINSLLDLYSIFYPRFSREECQKNLIQFHCDLAKPLTTFSKGMRRKAFLSFAFASHVNCLLLDECFDGLDPTSRDYFKKLMVGFLSDNPKAQIIIASHSLRELQDVCDNYFLLKDGKLQNDFFSPKAGLSLKKVHLAFADPVAVSEFKDLKILHADVDGRFLTLEVETEGRDLEKYFAPFHPLVLDISEVSLEEAFLYTTGVNL